MLVYDKTTKKIVDSTALDVVDRILQMRKNNSPWEVIDYLIQIWYETAPEDGQGTLITVRDLKETRKDPTFGQTDDKNMDRRLVVLFPLGLQSLIRKVYTAEELPFDKEFVLKFANKYKSFRIPEKI